MSDQSNRISTTVPEVNSASTDAEGEAASRRGFLKVGAAVAVGLLGACSDAGNPLDHGEEGGSDKTGTGGKITGAGGKSGGDTAAAGGSSQSEGAGGSKVDSSTSGKGGATPEGSDGKPQGAGGRTGTGSGGGKTPGGKDAGAGGTTKVQGSGGTKVDGGGSSKGGSSNAGGSTSTTDGGGTTPGGSSAENRGASCKIGTITSKANSKLPDPFKFLDGTRISKKEDWACLRAELSAALQACIYGPKMPAPDSLKATFSGGKLNIEMTVGSNKKTLSLAVSGGNASTPTPCLITCGSSSLPKLSGVATIDMQYNGIASESNLNGLVKDLYGNACAKSGALIDWAWATSRIIDALEQCPEAGVNVKSIATTGCSRCGKGALAMGAFDERVALTLMQEGGSGGSALWRVSTAEKKAGANIQEATEIVGEAAWQGSDFKSYVNSVDKLPADQHFAVALCAPRAVLLLENDIDWLGPVATYGGGVAGRMVFEALGIKDRCGVSVAANHSHCAFPSAQQKFLDAFVTRFLKGGTADTNVDDFHVSNTSKLGKFDKAQWIDWDIPTLSGNLPWDPFA